MTPCRQCSSAAKSVYHEGACPKPPVIGLIRMAAGTGATDRLRGTIRGR